MTEPTGPVWQRAKAEQNWLVYRLVPKGEGKKPAKLPQLNGRNEDRSLAAVYTFAEAKKLLTKPDLGLGYLPRPGSAMVVLDLDKVLGPGDRWQEDVLPGMANYLTEESYAEVSPSQTGIHVLLPREGWPTDSIDGAGPLGLHASDKYFVTVSLDQICDQLAVAPAPKLQAAVLPTILKALEERHSEQQAQPKGTGWFDTLEPDDRLALVLDVLMALPEGWVRDREHWLHVTFALRAYPELFEAWDVWSQQAPQHYDAEDNSEVWFGRERAGETIGIGSFLHWGEEAGVDMRPYRAMASAARAQRLGERLERVMPDAMAQAAQEPPHRPRLTPAELVEEGLSRIVRHEPSGRYMNLAVPATIHTSESSTLHGNSILRMYPIKMRARLDGESEADYANVPTAGAMILQQCWMTMEGPIFDPRVPFGAVYPERHGIHDYVRVNKMKLREVDPEASTDPKHPALKLWAELLEQVFPIPRERVWMEQWVANKARKPWERMVGVLSIAREQGTGRGIFLQVLRRLFGLDNVEELKVEDMFGATSQWNDWMVKLMVFVGEASDEENAGIARHAAQKRKVYEQLKDMIDPGEKFVRMNIKGGKIGSVQSFTSFLICSNHEDGLPIPRGDRRVTVVDGNEERASEAWAARMVDGLRDSPEALAVVWRHLSEAVSMEGFRSDLALVTHAKAVVQEAGRFPLDEELEEMMEAVGWPLFVTMGLVEKLAVGHSDLARQMSKDDGLRKAVDRWVKANSRPLLGDPTEGSRKVRFGGHPGQVRVRVLKKAEAGKRRSEVDGMTNDKVAAWLEELEKATLIVDLSQATGCRAMHKGMRVVK